MWDLLQQTEKKALQHSTKAEFERIMKEYYDNNIKNAIGDLTRLVEVCKDQQDYLVLTRAYNLMGIIYASIGSTAMEVDCYLHALDYASEFGLTYVELVCLNNIGSHYQDTNEHERAIVLFKEAYAGMQHAELKADESLDNLHMILLENMAISSLKLGKQAEAEEFYIRAKELSNEKPKVRIPFELFLLKSMLDWKEGKKEEVWTNLPTLEDHMKKIWEPAGFLSQIKEYIQLLKEMKAYEYWKRIIEYAYEKIKQYNSKSRLLEAIEFELDYAKTMNTADTENYLNLCRLYVDTALELKEQNRQDKIQIANVKIQLFEEEKERLETQREKQAMQELAEKDNLTGLGNRYSLRKYGRDLLEKSKEEHTQLVVGILDVDCFKQYNDTYGHVAGDKCLIMISDVIKASMKKAVEAGACGKAFRYGGDEFLVLVTGISNEMVKEIAKGISIEVQKLRLINEKSPVGELVSLSQGYYCQIPRDDDELEDVLKKADIQLYRVKENKRNGFEITFGS